jgi:uncharacterized protein YwqG
LPDWRTRQTNHWLGREKLHEKELNEPSVPAIWFRRHSGTTSSSRLGGLPTLPLDVEWPRQRQSGTPLHFLAQIDLSHLPPTPLENAANTPCLPRAGFLFFFADMVEEMLWGDNGGPFVTTRVIFTDHAAPERSPPDDTPDIGHPFGEKRSQYTSGKIAFDRAAQEPHVIETFAETISIPDDVVGAAAEDPDRYNCKPGSPFEWPVHQMLGFAMNIQGTAEEVHAEGILLLQIDSDKAVDAEFLFCDMGAAQYWIEPVDLAAGRFERAWATTEGG